tara:strand:- start:921 stop:1106 length:186 start_codon:yes stop_codon:yes gene_type:complete
VTDVPYSFDEVSVAEEGDWMVSDVTFPHTNQPGIEERWRSDPNPGPTEARIGPQLDPNCPN